MRLEVSVSLLFLWSFLLVACGRSDVYGIDVSIRDQLGNPVEGAFVGWKAGTSEPSTEELERTQELAEAAGPAYLTDAQGSYVAKNRPGACAYGGPKHSGEPGYLVVFREGYATWHGPYDRHDAPHLDVVLAP